MWFKTLIKLKSKPTYKIFYGGWKSKSVYALVEDPYIKVAASPTNFDTPDKENVAFVAAIMLAIVENSEDAVALELGNVIFGGGFLNSPLATNLRQKTV